jgi:cation:H+ antiporter
MIGEIILGLFAVFVLVYSAEFVVDRLIRIAHHFGVSGTFIGLTVLSIGTSLPEIASHFMASVGILNRSLNYEIASATVLGANIGSDVIQQTLILGVVIFIVGGLTFTSKFLKRSYSLMIGTTLMCLILGLDFHYSRIDGMILFGSFIAYMIYLYKVEKREPISVEEQKHHIGWDVTFALAGLGVLLGSSTIVLRTTELLVESTGVGGSLIGVMSLGIASALPEMFTAIQGAKKGEKGISVGTLIGSNIINPLVAIGGGAMISTYVIPKPLIYWDLPMETISATLLLIWLLFHKKKLGKGGAIYLILLYFVYIGIRIWFFSVD